MKISHENRKNYAHINITQAKELARKGWEVDGERVSILYVNTPDKLLRFIIDHGLDSNMSEYEPTIWGETVYYSLAQ